jgi:hypothetical protein
MALAEGEWRKAARPADVRGIRPAWQGASLPTDLAEAIEDEVDAVEARLAPGEFEASGGIGLPPGLADRLMVVAAAPPGWREPGRARPRGLCRLLPARPW